MKFKLSLACIMVITIVIGLLYLVLDDKVFCLKNHQTEDATPARIVGRANRKEKDNAVT